MVLQLSNKKDVLMKAMQAIKVISKIKGISFYRMSLEMGKSKQYVSSIVGRKSNPQIDTYINMLSTCEYTLCALPIDKVPEEAIIIDNKDEAEPPISFGGTRNMFSSMFDWETSDKTLNDDELLYRIHTKNNVDSLYFTASAGTSKFDLQEHARQEMTRYFGKKGPSMIESVERVPFCDELIE